MRKYRVVSKVDHVGRIWFYPQRWIGFAFIGVWIGWLSGEYARQDEDERCATLAEACTYIKEKKAVEQRRKDNADQHNRVHKCDCQHK